MDRKRKESENPTTTEDISEIMEIKAASSTPVEKKMKLEETDKNDDDDSGNTDENDDSEESDESTTKTIAENKKAADAEIHKEFNLVGKSDILEEADDNPYTPKNNVSLEPSSSEPKIKSLSIFGSYGPNPKLRLAWSAFLNRHVDTLEELRLQGTGYLSNFFPTMKNVKSLKITSFFMHNDETHHNFTMGIELGQVFPNMTSLELVAGLNDENSYYITNRSYLIGDCHRDFKSKQQAPDFEPSVNAQVCSKVTHLKLDMAKWSQENKEKCKELLLLLLRICPSVTHLELVLSNEFKSFDKICGWSNLEEIKIEMVANTGECLTHYKEYNGTCEEDGEYCAYRKGTLTPVLQKALCGITQNECQQLMKNREKMPEILEKLIQRPSLCKLNNLQSLQIRLSKSNESKCKEARHAFPISVISAMCAEKIKKSPFNIEFIIRTTVFESEILELKWLFEEQMSKYAKLTR